MASAAKSSSLLALRYANALLDLAALEGSLDQIAQDLKDMTAMIAGSADLTHMLRSPVISASAQKSAIEALAVKAQFQPLTRKFLGLLAQNRRLAALEGIVAAFGEEYERRQGGITASVRTVQALTPAQEKNLIASVFKNAGGKVSLRKIVDPRLLGGMILTFGSRMIDDSAARKIERLKAALKNESGGDALTQSKA